MSVAKEISEEWMQLGITLSLPYTELVQIKEKHSSDPKERNMAMLTSWRNRLPLDDQMMSLAKLSCALVTVNRRDLSKYTEIDFV